MKEEKYTAKYKWCTLVLVITMTVLLIRLWDLQIMRGSEMRKLSEQNRIRVKKILAPRGVIKDRAGKVLADTRPSFNIYLTPEDIKDFNQTIDGLSQLIACDREEIMEKMKAASGMPPSFPIKIKSDIPMDEVAKIEANRVYTPGVSIQIEPKRNYPYAASFAHVIGYVSEISDEELKDKKKHKNYSPGDYIGKYGLERQYEKELRGTDGEKRVEVDAMGREIRTLDVVDPIPGNSLYLNMDLDLQLAADKAIQDKKGAAIALNPKTGGVLVLASRPGFDPNLFASGINNKDWQKIALDKAHPLQ
ncbi:MAG: penicillin-binding protein 2, partial [Syntrophorhabdus sp.]